MTDSVAVPPFRFGLKQISPANQRFGGAVAPWPDPNRGDTIEAAGERIVAFAQPGKPLVMPFWRQRQPVPCRANRREIHHFATVSKAPVG